MSDKTKPNFDGGYIKASQEAYDLLVEAGYEPLEMWMNCTNVHYYIQANQINETCKPHRLDGKYRQFYINKGQLSWDEPRCGICSSTSCNCKQLDDEIEAIYQEAQTNKKCYTLAELQDEETLEKAADEFANMNSMEDLDNLAVSEKNLHDKFLDTDERDLPVVFRVTEDESSFASKAYAITNALAEMLIEKNDKYGNSALESKRIFSNADPIEQIKVRIDDKLSRMSNQKEEDEDVVQDLLGYLVLLKIAKGNKC